MVRLDEDDQWASRGEAHHPGSSRQDVTWANATGGEPRTTVAGHYASQPQPTSATPTPAKTTPTRRTGGGGDSDLWETFKGLDSNGSGLIDATELRKALQQRGDNLTDERVEHMIKMADKNGDGQVNYAEFVAMTRSEDTGPAVPVTPDAPVAPAAEAKPLTYSVTFQTGTDSGAGTDAGVYIQLFGDMMPAGSEREIAGNSPGKFERGTHDEFQIAVQPVGNLEKIKVGTDNTGEGAAWKLESVVVRELAQKPAAASATHKTAVATSVADADAAIDGATVVKPVSVAAVASPPPQQKLRTWTFEYHDWLGGQGRSAEVTLLANPAAGGGAGTPGQPFGGVAGGQQPGGGFGGAPPPSLVGSVKQLSALTSEVEAIRKSLAEIEQGKEAKARAARAAAEAGGGGGESERLLPLQPARGKARRGGMRGLAGVIQARNERDKKRMEELVKLVTGSLKSMEDSLEKRLEKLESNVQQVNSLAGVMGEGGGGGGGGGASRTTTRADAGGDASSTAMMDAMKKYEGYMGRENNVLVNLLQTMASRDKVDEGLKIEYETKATQMRASLEKDSDMLISEPQWCDGGEP
jgi:prefoldin subunit 5